MGGNDSETRGFHRQFAACQIDSTLKQATTLVCLMLNISYASVLQHATLDTIDKIYHTSST